MKTYYQNKFNNIETDYKRKIDQLAEKARRELVVPICKKYNFGYMAGNGDYFFMTSTNHAITPLDDELFEKYPGLKEVFDVLNIHINRAMNLGDYVGDVKRKIKCP